MSHFVIVGAGQAGSSLAAKLRSEGFEGQITLIGTETAPPYQRPPLSKAYLLGELPKERLFLRPESFYADKSITLRLDTNAVSLDPAKQRLTLSDGDVLHYDALALTTGANPRALPAAIGGHLDNVFTVRDLADADAMAPMFEQGRRALIIGGGYIGLEAAAVAAKRGVAVTLVEMADRILQRVACAETSDYFRNLHQSHGVTIREGVGLKQLHGDGAVTGAALSDGAVIDIDFAIVGVGIIPDTTLAEGAGLMLDQGIKTDLFSRTSDPHIWAAGDCASCLYEGQRLRIESVGNAIDQAENAALNMLGRDIAYQPKPWFWSDQYDCKLQIAGLNVGYTDVILRQGDKPGSQSHWYFANDRLRAIDAMNDPRSYMIGKRLIEAGKSPSPAALTDPATDLKSLLQG